MLIRRRVPNELTAAGDYFVSAGSIEARAWASSDRERSRAWEHALGVRADRAMQQEQPVGDLTVGKSRRRHLRARARSSRRPRCVEQHSQIRAFDFLRSGSPRVRIQQVLLHRSLGEAALARRSLSTGSARQAHNPDMASVEPEVGVSESVFGLPAPPLRSLVAWYSGYRQAGTSPAVHRGLPSPYLLGRCMARDRQRRALSSYTSSIAASCALNR